MCISIQYTSYVNCHKKYNLILEIGSKAICWRVLLACFTVSANKFYSYRHHTYIVFILQWQKIKNCKYFLKRQQYVWFQSFYMSMMSSVTSALYSSFLVPSILYESCIKLLFICLLEEYSKYPFAYIYCTANVKMAG